jgi:hypothetical protein
VHDHLFHHDFGCVFHSQGDHGEGVADKDDVHASLVGGVGRGKVMGSEHGDWLFASVHGGYGGESDLSAGGG